MWYWCLIGVAVGIVIGVFCSKWHARKEMKGTLHLLKDPSDGSIYTYLTISEPITSFNDIKYVRFKIEIDAQK